MEIIKEYAIDNTYNFSMTDGIIDYGFIYEMDDTMTCEQIKADAIEFISNHTSLPQEFIAKYPNVIIGYKKHD